MNKEIILFGVLIIGLLGTVVPLLPGLILMFLAVLIYAIYDNWLHLSPLFVMNVGILTLLGIITDYFSGVLGAKKFGASKKGVWGGILGSILGILTMGPFGLIIGIVVGVLVGELVSGAKLMIALKISLGTLVGILGGALIRFIIAIIIVIMVFIKIY